MVIALNINNLNQNFLFKIITYYQLYKNLTWLCIGSYEVEILQESGLDSGVGSKVMCARLKLYCATVRG